MNFKINGRVIKNIPKNLNKLENLDDYIDDLDHKRLSKTERENMKAALMQQVMSNFIKGLKKYLAFEHIKTSEPITAAKVITRSHTYYVIVFANQKEVRCDYKIYQGAPVKTEIKRLY